MTTKDLCREIRMRGAVDVTAENIRCARRIARNEHLRLRRWVGLDATHPLVTDHAYPVGYRMLRDFPADVRVEVGDVLVTQAGAVA